MNPSYSVSAIVNHPVVDPGDSVKIEIFINGIGNITAHKMISHVPPELLEGDIEVLAFKFATNPDWKAAKPVCPPEVFRMGSPFTMRFSEHYFSQIEGADILNSEKVVYCGKETYAPLTLMFKLSKDAPAGQHSIPIKLIYTNSEISGVAETQASLTIRSFSERNANFLVGLLAFIIFIAPPIFTIAPNQLRPWVVGFFAVIFFIVLWFSAR